MRRGKFRSCTCGKGGIRFLHVRLHDCLRTDNEDDDIVVGITRRGRGAAGRGRWMVGRRAGRCASRRGICGSRCGRRLRRGRGDGRGRNIGHSGTLICGSRQLVPRRLLLDVPPELIDHRVGGIHTAGHLCLPCGRVGLVILHGPESLGEGTKLVSLGLDGGFENIEAE